MIGGGGIPAIAMKQHFSPSFHGLLPKMPFQTFLPKCPCLTSCSITEILFISLCTVCLSVLYT